MVVSAATLLIVLGAVHGVLLSVLLVTSRRNRPVGNRLLALMLVCYTLPLLKVALQEMGVASLDRPIWSFELLYGLGPSLYLYAKTVIDAGYTLKRSDGLHFVPLALEALYYASPLFHDVPTLRFGPAIDTLHRVWMIQQAGAVVSVVVYLGWTIHRLQSFSRWVENHSSEVHRQAMRWLQVPVAAYTGFFVVWLSLRLVDIVAFSDRLGPEIYHPLLVFLSASTYWIGTRGYLEQWPSSSGFIDRQAADEIVTRPPADSDELVVVFGRLEELMARDRPYLQNDLSLPELAGQLDVNPRLLSKVINTRGGVNFYDFVNRYRVEALQGHLDRGDRRTLLDLAHACGFGSKATFNHAFKKQTGSTPSEYRRRAVIGSPGARRPESSS
ncbi:MAG: helix-turn-helix domain-containing protein [Acidobacteriota bacterium]